MQREKQRSTKILTSNIASRKNFLKIQNFRVKSTKKTVPSGKKIVSRKTLRKLESKNEADR